VSTYLIDSGHFYGITRCFQDLITIVPVADLIDIFAKWIKVVNRNMIKIGEYAIVRHLDAVEPSWRSRLPMYGMPPLEQLLTLHVRSKSDTDLIMKFISGIAADFIGFGGVCRRQCPRRFVLCCQWPGMNSILPIPYRMPTNYQS
jgi:hypothetical protein